MKWAILAGAVAVLALVIFLGLGESGGGCGGDVMGYIAPTLMPLVRDASIQAGFSTQGLLSIGSVEALRRIQQGAVPDVFASVDVELLKEAKAAAPYREVMELGRFRIALICAVRIRDLSELASLRTALSDPTKAPIGYRELALVWLLYRGGVVDLRWRYEALGVRYVEWSRGVNITVPLRLSPSTYVELAPNLDGSWSHLETGGVDCVFAHTPFIYGRFTLGDRLESTELWDLYAVEYRGRTYYVYFFKPPYDFFNDPPAEMYVHYVDERGALIKSIRVVRFEAFVISYTPRGDCLIEALRKVDLAKYGLFK